MSKEKNNKIKSDKKAPAKTSKEKKAAKVQKKIDKNNISKTS
jgi:hypothetical protein